MEGLETLEHRLPVVQGGVGDVNLDVGIGNQLPFVPGAVLESKLHMAVDCGEVDTSRQSRGREHDQNFS